MHFIVYVLFVARPQESVRRGVLDQPVTEGPVLTGVGYDRITRKRRLHNGNTKNDDDDSPDAEKTASGNGQKTIEETN